MMNQSGISETFVARRSEDFEIVLPRSMIQKALKQLAASTNAPAFQDAMELVWFKFDPNVDAGTRDCVSMLLTLYRCTLDGNVRPPLDLEDLYERTYNTMEAEYGSFPNDPTPWRPDNRG
ncbi:MAG: hypothetical protein PHC90_01750 [Syntrophorhabdaceae bacterium]|nr:hypothetical protein [Syntrophorhabdaceae bacterium]